MASKANLTSVQTLVESPFIIVNIGGITFGSYSAQGYGAGVKVTYPNYMKSMSVQKINGTVNTYTIVFSYQVRPGEDPNRLDKIFSRATKDRQIALMYGDWNAPNYIYKEESAIITNIRTNLNMSSSCIEYTLSCTSDAVGLTSVKYNFPARIAKPSDVLRQLLQNSSYGLKDVFTGMRNSQKIISNNLIASNDKKVQLKAMNTTPLSYMNYLVDSMIDEKNTSTGIQKNGTYMLTIHDDKSSSLGGTYFKVTQITHKTNSFVATDTYVLDINYPTDDYVTQFSLNNDQSWAILYDYTESIKQEEYVYTIDTYGNVVSDYSPSLTRDRQTLTNSARKTSWWSKMTQFPVEATVTIKGLTRPSILMTYVYLNVWFAGAQKHISSGLYIITKQVDTIDSTGYKTTLTLLRVGGDTE